jgi:hypothetical protein
MKQGVSINFKYYTDQNGQRLVSMRKFIRFKYFGTYNICNMYAKYVSIIRQRKNTRIYWTYSKGHICASTDTY